MNIAYVVSVLSLLIPVGIIGGVAIAYRGWKFGSERRRAFPVLFGAFTTIASFWLFVTVPSLDADRAVSIFGVTVPAEVSSVVTNTANLTVPPFLFVFMVYSLFTSPTRQRSVFLNVLFVTILIFGTFRYIENLPSTLQAIGL